MTEEIYFIKKDLFDVQHGFISSKTEHLYFGNFSKNDDAEYATFFVNPDKDFVGTTKNEAIDKAIAHLQSMRDE